MHDLFERVLEQIDVDGTIIAGGAVRDLFYNKTVDQIKDIDVYIHENRDFDYAAHGFVVDEEQVGFEEYEGVPGLLKVVNTHFGDRGPMVQFIHVPRSPYDHIQTFDLSTSYAYFDHRGATFLKPFLDSRDTRQIKVLRTENLNKTLRRANAVQNKFGHFHRDVLLSPDVLAEWEFLHGDDVRAGIWVRKVRVFNDLDFVDANPFAEI